MIRYTEDGKVHRGYWTPSSVTRHAHLIADALDAANAELSALRAAKEVAAYHVEHRPDGGYFVAARNWEANKNLHPGARVTELLRGRVIEAGTIDEEMLLFFPSIVEAQLQEQELAANQQKGEKHD